MLFEQKFDNFNQFKNKMTYFIRICKLFNKMYTIAHHSERKKPASIILGSQH